MVSHKRFVAGVRVRGKGLARHRAIQGTVVADPGHSGQGWIAVDWDDPEKSPFERIVWHEDIEPA